MECARFGWRNDGPDCLTCTRWALCCGGVTMPCAVVVEGGVLGAEHPTVVLSKAAGTVVGKQRDKY